MYFYFSPFEKRRPPAPLAHHPGVEFLWQMLIIAALLLGANYIRWRWMDSLNYEALWYAVPLALAETLAYIGTCLFTFNLWQTRDPLPQPAPDDITQCLAQADGLMPRPLKVDLFIATYSEDPELVRLSIQDAKRLVYPHPLDYKIHVLDDGRRETMRQVASQEGVNYLTRDNNAGFKAGNLRNGIEQTDGDFIVICDADTRVFPTLLSHTLGYFRDPKVAWVQTPQWFYDLAEGTPLPHWLARRGGRLGQWLGRGIERLVGPIRVGEDPFLNDPQMFYDIIQRRRNRAYASFCCGAASIHRREAIMQTALRQYALDIESEIARYTDDIANPQLRQDLQQAMLPHVAYDMELMPYRFHVSEDIYTSIMLHGDLEHPWRSVMHPQIESKMLSPQDLQTWMIQRFKYAAGSLDILLHDEVLFSRQLHLSRAQKLLYGATFWSYLACTWNLIFLIAPLIYLFSGIPPLSTYSTPFYLHFVPYLVLCELAFMFGTWGISAWNGKASYLALFSMNLRALDNVLRGEKIRFRVTPKERQQGNFLALVKPQLAIVILTLLALCWGALQLAWGNIVDPSGYIINIFWSVMNILAMMPMILAALWQPPAHDSDADAADSREC